MSERDGISERERLLQEAVLDMIPWLAFAHDSDLGDLAQKELEAVERRAREALNPPDKNPQPVLSTT